MSWPHRWHLVRRLSVFASDASVSALLTNIPGIKRGKDGANGKEVVELVERHLGGVALPSSVVCSAESKTGGWVGEPAE